MANPQEIPADLAHVEHMLAQEGNFSSGERSFSGSRVGLAEIDELVIYIVLVTAFYMDYPLNVSEVYYKLHDCKVSATFRAYVMTGA